MLELPRLPLSNHRLFHTMDLDEAREHVARVFCPHGLSTFGGGAKLDACHHSARLHRDVSLNYVQYGAGVNIEPGYLGDFYLLQIPLRGGASVRCGSQSIEASSRMASLPSPTERLSMRWAPDSPHLIVRFSRVALLGQLESLIQAPVHQPLVFELGVPLDEPAAAPMLNFVKYLCTTMEESTGLGGGQLASQAEGYLISSLLQLTRHNYSNAMQQGHRRSLLPRSVRRAQEYLHSHLQETVSLGDLCQHMGISARSLQLAFKEHLGQNPMAYLRGIRLDGVRETLKGAQPGDKTTVTHVAEAYGFFHLGHFCAHYQSRFGEPPSEALRRARGVMQVPSTDA
jgi:AraC-like DNA-binding protein